MLTAEEYLARVRRVVTLPSGGEVTVRMLQPWDFLSVGDIPLAFQEAVREGNREQVKKIAESDIALVKKIKAAAIINGVVSMNIVDKHPRECAKGEISVEDIKKEDSEAIFDAISSLNSIGTEAGKSIRRFPEEPGSPGDGGSDGGTVREVADGNPASAVG